MKLAVEKVRPNPRQARKHFDEGRLSALAESLKRDGQLHPILVRRDGKGLYEIVQGERRWRAAKLVGLKTLNVTVRKVDDDQARELGLVENAQRDDLTPIEEAEALEALCDAGKTQAEAAALVGRTQSYVAQKLRLLGLPEPVAVFLREGLLTENHVRQLLRSRDWCPERFTERHEWLSDDDGLEGLRRFIRGVEPHGLAERCQRDLAFREDTLANLVLWVGHYHVEALMSWPKYVAQHDAEVPCWVGQAWWWGMMATSLPDMRWSVRTLANMLTVDGWFGCVERVLPQADMEYCVAELGYVQKRQTDDFTE